MPSEVVTVVEIRQGVQYTGSNSADVVAAVQGATLVSEVGGVLTIATEVGEFAIPTGEWMRWREVGDQTDYYQPVPDIYFQGIYRRYPRMVTRQGYGNIAAGGLGGAQDVTVTLDAPMSTTGYVPRVQLLGAPGLIGGHGLVPGAPWTIVDEDTIAVHLVSEIAAAAITGGVYVTATELV